MSMYFNFSTHKYVFYVYRIDIHCKYSNITKTYPGKINIARKIIRKNINIKTSILIKSRNIV